MVGYPSASHQDALSQTTTQNKDASLRSIKENKQNNTIGKHDEMMSGDNENTKAFLDLARVGYPTMM